MLRLKDVAIATVHGQPQVALCFPKAKTGVNQGVTVERPWVAAALARRVQKLRSWGVPESRRLFSLSQRGFADA